MLLFLAADLEYVTVSRKTAPWLLKQLSKDPDRHVDMIVTVDGDPHRCESRLRAFGLVVRRKFRLTQKMALSGPARGFSALSNEDWVMKLEEDKPVRTST